MKKIAIITDVHGNLEALEAIMNDIVKRDIDDVICLGDIVDLGPNSKECIDLFIKNNISSLLGNHELYLLRGTDITPFMSEKRKQHCNFVKNSLTEKEINYMKNCPLSIEYINQQDNKKYIFSHYLLHDEKAPYPFERLDLKKDVSLWKNYYRSDTIYFVGHLHRSFAKSEIDGIVDDTNTNIIVVDSAGCSHDNNASYMIIEIASTLQIKRIKVPYDREKFVQKLINTDFPDKKHILEYFYGLHLN